MSALATAGTEVCIVYVFLDYCRSICRLAWAKSGRAGYSPYQCTCAAGGKCLQHSLERPLLRPALTTRFWNAGLHKYSR